MNKLLLVLCALAWITAGCKSDKKVSLTGDEPVEVADFIEFFPQVQLPPRPTGARFIHVQRNLPGMLGRLNGVFSRGQVNIAAQFYQTDGEVGYVVLETDATDADAEALLAEIRAIPGTIRARLLYERE